MVARSARAGQMGAERRRSHVYFDASRYCRHLEAAFEHMQARRVQGQPAASFLVDRLR